MKRWMIQVVMLLMLGIPALAQNTGTHPSPNEQGATRPTKKSVQVTNDTVRAAQEKLAAGGYFTGPASGSMDAGTRTAIRRYQAAEGITVNGRLDETTLSHLNVAGGSTLRAAPGDFGRGAQAAGHNVKEGHPIEGGKAIGEGTGRSAKKVGEGTKSGAVEGGTAVGEGAQDVGHGAKEGAKKVGHGVKKGVKKVTGKDEKKPETTPPPQI